MKSFSDFLKESWWWHVTKHDKKPTKLHRAIRSIEVGNHPVNIHFEPHEEEVAKFPFSKKNKGISRPKEYDVSYEVHGSIKDKGHVTDPQKQKEILQTVHHTINKFIQRIKPKALHFVSVDDPQRRKLHIRLAHHLAKKYGGKDSLYNYPEDPILNRNLWRSTVRFKK